MNVNLKVNKGMVFLFTFQLYNSNTLLLYKGLIVLPQIFSLRSKTIIHFKYAVLYKKLKKKNNCDKIQYMFSGRNGI